MIFNDDIMNYVLTLIHGKRFDAANIAVIQLIKCPDGITAEFFEQAIKHYGLTDTIIKALATYYAEDVK